MPLACNLLKADLNLLGAICGDPSLLAEEDGESFLHISCCPGFESSLDSEFLLEKEESLKRL